MPRMDDWTATNASLGSVRDKSQGVIFARRASLTVEQLNVLYRQSPTAARIVDRPIDDAFRNGWCLEKIVMRDGSEAPDAQALQTRLDKLGGLQDTFDSVVKRAAKWARLYGASTILCPTHDYDRIGRRRRLKEPIGQIQQAFPLAVMPAQDVEPLDMDDTFGSATFQRVLNYQILTATSSPEIHHSRVVTFEPIELPATVLQQSQDKWGPSVLERMFDALARSGAAQSHAVAQMYVSSLLFLHMEGYREQIKTADGKAQTRKFLLEFQQALNALGIAHLDKDDLVQAVSLDNRSAHKLISTLRDEVAAAGDQPREILFNESPAGLNAGELSGPQEIWFAVVAALQKEWLTPRMVRIMEIAFASWGLLIESFEIVWEPLWTRSDEGQATVDKTHADTDQVYWTIGALSTDEIRTNRFVEQRAGLPELPEIIVEPLALEAGPDDLAAHEQAGAEKPQDTALNGAQIASLVGVVQAVAAGELPRDSGIEIIRVSFPAVAHRAELILGSAGLAPALGAAPGPGLAPVVPQAVLPPPTTDEAPDDLLSPRDAAQRLSVPTRTITRRIELGELRYWGLGAHKRVSLADVTKLAKAHEEPEEPEDDEPTETP